MKINNGRRETPKRDTETTEVSSHGETGAHGPAHREHFSVLGSVGTVTAQQNNTTTTATTTATATPTPEPAITTLTATPTDSPGFGISTTLIAGLAILLTASRLST